MPVGDNYHGDTFAIATMHSKERAVGKSFGRWLGAEVIVAPGINTDVFGTFIGDVPRRGTMLKTAEAKARSAIESTGLLFGLGSEGSFGPHPVLPFIASSTEVLLIVDLKNGLVVHDTAVTHRTNFSSRTCEPNEDVSDFLHSVKFPSHAVVVKPNSIPIGETETGITALQGIRAAVGRAAAISRDGLALIVTDMRAHLNPTRMAVIRALSSRLARRLATRCPACRTPGFGIVETVRGLPCAWCGEPTQAAMAELHRCAKCGFESSTSKLKQKVADQGQCPQCNP